MADKTRAGNKGGFGKLVSLQEAREIITARIKILPNRKVMLSRALGRVLAADILAPIDVPHFAKSAMDGYAVIASETFSATNVRPKHFTLAGRVFPGQTFSKRIARGLPLRGVGRGQCVEIATGAPLPEGTDAVVMVEYTERVSDKVIMYKSVAPGENVIKTGSDIKKGDRVLSKGTRLSPRFTGLLSALGISSVPVKEKPKVAVFATGNEVIKPPAKIKKAQIYDINSRAIIDALLQENCSVFDLGIARDNREEIKKKIIRGIEKSDLVLLSGSSSLGATDLVAEIVNEMGEILIHGIAVKPGKPTVVGKIRDKLVIGLPGHPMSALSNFYILIVPLLRGMLESKEPARRCVPARLSRKVPSTIGRYEFLPVRMVKSNGKQYAEPILKGSSAITTLSEADGFVEIEENVEVIEKGKLVQVNLF
ncbi:MAG: gephyrin-like molybdotransferase Glp [Candidatus Omnitrophota bacterium]